MKALRILPLCLLLGIVQGEPPKPLPPDPSSNAGDDKRTIMSRMDVKTREDRVLFEASVKRRIDDAVADAEAKYGTFKLTKPKIKHPIKPLKIDPSPKIGFSLEANELSRIDDLWSTQYRTGQDPLGTEVADGTDAWIGVAVRLTETPPPMTPPFVPLISSTSMHMDFERPVGQWPAVDTQLLGTAFSSGDWFVSEHDSWILGSLIGSGASDAYCIGAAPKGGVILVDESVEGLIELESVIGQKFSLHNYSRLLGWDEWDEGNIVPVLVYTDENNVEHHGLRWYGNSQLSVEEPNGAGQYDATSRDADDLAYTNPNHLMIAAAGNLHIAFSYPLQILGHTPGPWHYLGFNGSQWFRGDADPLIPAQHPARLGDKSRFDTIYPGIPTAKNSLTVGTVNADKSIAAFSTFGPTDDGRIKPDLVASGVSEPVIVNSGTYARSGSCLAASTVAGGMLSLSELVAKLYGQASYSGKWDADVWKALAIHCAEDLGEAGPDFIYGWGLFDAWEMARVIEQDSTYRNNNLGIRGVPHQFIKTGRVKTGHPLRIPINIQGPFPTTRTEPFKVTVYWTDETCADVDDESDIDSPIPRLENDIGVRVSRKKTSSQPSYYSWKLDPANPTAAATWDGGDHRNNVEQVYINPTEFTTAVNNAYSVTLDPGLDIVIEAESGIYSGEGVRVVVIISGADPLPLQRIRPTSVKVIGSPTDELSVITESCDWDDHEITSTDGGAPVVKPAALTGTEWEDEYRRTRGEEPPPARGRGTWRDHIPEQEENDFTELTDWFTRWIKRQWIRTFDTTVVGVPTVIPHVIHTTSSSHTDTTITLSNNPDLVSALGSCGAYNAYILELASGATVPITQWTSGGVVTVPDGVASTISDNSTEIVIRPASTIGSILGEDNDKTYNVVNGILYRGLEPDTDGSWSTEEGSTITVPTGMPAGGTVTFSMVLPAAGDTITINGEVYTYTTNATLLDNEFTGYSLKGVAQSLADSINGNIVSPSSPDPYIKAARLGDTNVTMFIALERGTVGNSYTLSTTGTSMVLSNTTLTGGQTGGGNVRVRYFPRYGVSGMLNGYDGNPMNFPADIAQTGTENGRATYYKFYNYVSYYIKWSGAAWEIRKNANVCFSSTENVMTPDQVTTWVAQGSASGTPSFDVLDGWFDEYGKPAANLPILYTNSFRVKRLGGVCDLNLYQVGTVKFWPTLFDVASTSYRAHWLSAPPLTTLDSSGLIDYIDPLDPSVQNDPFDTITVDHGAYESVYVGKVTEPAVPSVNSSWEISIAAQPTDGDTFNVIGIDDQNNPFDIIWTFRHNPTLQYEVGIGSSMSETMSNFYASVFNEPGLWVTVNMANDVITATSSVPGVPGIHAFGGSTVVNIFSVTVLEEGTDEVPQVAEWIDWVSEAPAGAVSIEDGFVLDRNNSNMQNEPTYKLNPINWQQFIPTP